MKNLLVTVISLFIFTTTNAQRFVKPVITENDRQHILLVFKNQKNPDFVWKEATIKVLKSKDIPKENYSTSVAKENKLEWLQFGPMEGDTVMMYEGVYLKKYNSYATYYLKPQEFAQPQYASNSPQSKQPTQKAPKQPKGDGRGLEKAVMIGGGILQTGARVLGIGGMNGVIGGGSDLGLGGGAVLQNQSQGMKY
ncbi:hypothetical protein K2Q02_01610 [Patescibacteria group bacterium]|nr:hypothetical protein [Patescibacteria group bacterium]